MPEKGYILSQKDRDLLAQTVRKVNAQTQSFGAGNRSANGLSQGPAFVSVGGGDQSDYSPKWRWLYSATLFGKPYSSEEDAPASIGSVTRAFNVVELLNTDTTASGFSGIDPDTEECGVIIEVKPAPSGLYPIIGIYWIEDDWAALFYWQNHAVAYVPPEEDE